MAGGAVKLVARRFWQIFYAATQLRYSGKNLAQISITVKRMTFETPEENMAELKAQATEFVALRLPVLEKLGIA